uniref:TATA element modulatory factor n=1 Tax=Magallana gigas TaxID=29159 RepID=A0A8W8I4M3_MAGGI
MQRSASPTTIDSPNTYITMMPVQGQPLRAFGDDISDPGLRNGEMSLNENEAENNNVVTADNFENEVDSFQSPTSGTNMAHYQGSEETHNFLSDIQNQSREVSEKNTSAESNDVWREDAVVETTVIASDANSGDDYTSQSVQNENIDHSNINSEEMQRSPSPTTIDSPNSSITSTPVQEQPSRAFGDDVSDSGLRNGEMSLYKNEAENDNAVDADNFENEMDSTQSSESRNDMAHYEGSNETLGYNLLSDIQLKTSQEKEIEKLQRELNIKNEYLEQERQSSAALKEEAQALKEQITNKEDVLKELEKNNSDLLSNYLEMKKKEEELAAELKEMQENYQYEKRRSEELSGQLSLRNEEVITTENKYKQEIEELKAKYKTEKDQAEKEKELLKQRVTKLTEGSQQLQAENKRIKDDLQLKSMECGNLKSERLRITGELNAAKKEIAELSNERDKLGAYITTVNDEVRQLRAALELKEAEKNAANGNFVV